MKLCDGKEQGGTSFAGRNLNALQCRTHNHKKYTNKLRLCLCYYKYPDPKKLLSDTVKIKNLGRYPINEQFQMYRLLWE